MLAPNKQNLLLLKKQKKSFQNGHKLLTEKRNGLIVAFLNLSRKGKKLEKETSSDLAKYIKKYRQSITFTSAADIINHIETQPSTLLSVEKKRMSGVRVQNLSIDVKPSESKIIKKDINTSLNNISYLFPMLLELVQLKTNAKKMANEILKTNRQLSNIERKVDDFSAQIKWMKNTLQEKENLEKSVLIKIFE